MVERKGKRLGYRFYLHGKCYKRYVWDTKAEAEDAEREKRVELKNNPPLPPSALSSIVAAYLVDSAERERSMWRLDGLRLSMKNHILPYFGESTPVSLITSGDVDSFIKASKRKGLKPKSVKNLVADLRACLNWAKAKKFLRENAVDSADTELIGSTKFVKAPLDLEAIERAAESIENPSDRAWFDVTRFTGMRKDEANRLQWADINFDLGMIHIPGSKTEDSDAWLPLAPVALDTLRKLSRDSQWVFPGRNNRTKGKKIYSRRRMFERIRKETGVHVTPKDLRDYFGTVMSGKVKGDANTLMRLMRHTSLNTTTKYMRTLHDSMRDALSNLGAASLGVSNAATGQKTAQNDMKREIARLKKLLASYGIIEENHGGGGRSRTADAADMSRGSYKTKH